VESSPIGADTTAAYRFFWSRAGAHLLCFIVPDILLGNSSDTT